MFAYQFGRYKYKQLPFGAVLAGYMFQGKIDEIFKDLPNVFSIANYYYYYFYYISCRL